MNRYVKWAAQPHSPRQRFGVLIPAGVFFLLLLPGLLIRLSRALDRRLRLPRLGPATRWPGLAATWPSPCAPSRCSSNKGRALPSPCCLPKACWQPAPTPTAAIP